MNIAIVAVAYNRVDSLSRLLGSLEQASYDDEKVTLIISIDKSKTDVVEVFADNYNWLHGNKIVSKHEENLGLRAHMLSLGKWFEQFDALVILEDDIVVSPMFYRYTCQTVEKYHACPDVAGISLYGFNMNYETGIPFTPMKDEHDVYFMNCAMSWGEIWMKESWPLFYDWYHSHTDFPELAHLPQSICRWNKKSWLKYHTRYCIEENKYFVHPYTSLSTNFSDVGEHWRSYENTVFQVPLQHGNVKNYRLPDFGSEGVCYDGFFENKALYEVLGLRENEVCLDLQGELKNRVNKRYWLTTKKADFKVIKSYGLNFRPIELNVIMNNGGDRIFLYDTHIKEKNVLKVSTKEKLYHYHINNMFLFIRQYGIKNLWSDICDYLYLKFKR